VHFAYTVLLAVNTDFSLNQRYQRALFITDTQLVFCVRQELNYYISMYIIRILLASGLLPQRSGRGRRPLRMRFVVGKVTLKEVFLLILQFSPVNIRGRVK